MAKVSFAKVWADVLFIGPRLIWRLAKMAIASARVIRHRSRLIARGPKTGQEQLEYRVMVQEKIQGIGEASRAYLRALNNSGSFSTKAIMAAGSATFNAWLLLFSGRNSLSFAARYVRFSLSLGWLLFLVYTQSSLFVPKLLLNSTAPLDKRVSANAKRLSSAS